MVSENSGALLHYSSTVCIALAIEAEREVTAVAEKTEKDTRKAQVVENKQRKETVAQERAL